MKPDVCAGANRAAFGRGSLHVMQAHGDSISAQQLKDALVIPAWITKLHHMMGAHSQTGFPCRAADGTEKSFQAFEVDAEIRRELIKNRTESWTKFAHVLEQ